MHQSDHPQSFTASPPLPAGRPATLPHSRVCVFGEGPQCRERPDSPAAARRWLHSSCWRLALFFHNPLPIHTLHAKLISWCQSCRLMPLPQSKPRYCLDQAANERKKRAHHIRRPKIAQYGKTLLEIPRQQKSHQHAGRGSRAVHPKESKIKKDAATSRNIDGTQRRLASNLPPIQTVPQGKWRDTAKQRRKWSVAGA